MEWVVKIGGSLFPEKAVKLTQELVGKNVLVVCGGGELANLIRQYDNNMKFSSTTSHQAAILCMDILGILLADKVDGAEIVQTISPVNKILSEGKLPVMVPSRYIHYLDPLEHSWRVTSDSISLYIAHHAKAKLLIATDVDGIYTRKPSSDGAQFLTEITAKKLLNFGETSLDENFAELLLQYPLETYVVNGQHPERVIAILDGRSSKHTFIGGD